MKKYIQYAKANSEKFNEKIAKLSKIAKKLGVMEPVVTPVNEFTRNFEGYIFDMIQVEVEWETVKLNGWKFIAKLQHVNNDVIIFNIEPDTKVPDMYLKRGAVCDHCNAKVYRKDTFIVQHENGEFKQVGRSCLKDFMGFHGSPETIAQMYEWANETNIELEEVDSESFGYGHRHRQEVRLLTERYLTYCACLIRNFGYQKRSEYKMSTAGEALYQYDKNKKEFKSLLTQEDAEMAQKVISWINENTADNEYMHNLKVMVKNGVTFNGAGIMASSIVAYMREVEGLVYKKVKLVDEYFGEIGQKGEFKLMFTGQSTYDGYYGTGYIIRFLYEGMTAVWFTSKGVDAKEGTVFNAKCTIKGHDTYNNKKQTQLTRVKLLNMVQEEEPVTA